MRRGALAIVDIDAPASVPRYELRAMSWGAGDDELEVWQTPSPATPHVKAPVRVAGLRGRTLELVYHRALRRLARSGVRVRASRVARDGRWEPNVYAIDEELALMLGLVFRALAPMRNREKMLRVVDGIEAMGREEAAYWLGMTMHRRNSRRVLGALRMLLTDPSPRVEVRA